MVITWKAKWMSLVKKRVNRKLRNLIIFLTLAVLIGLILSISKL